MINKPLPELDKSKVRWEQDLDISIEGETWGELCQNGVTSYLNSRYRMIQFNFLHQMCITPSKLYKFNKKNSPLCSRCGVEEGTFLHSTWTWSPLVQGFWQKVCHFISDIHGVSFPPDPEVCLLGNYTNSNITQDNAIRLTEILLIIAKKCIAIKWKSDTVIPINLWLSEVNNCVPLEKNNILVKKKK